MCLIIIKKKGVKVTPELYKGIARSYHLRNKDGMGFSIKKGQSIYISKGYFDLKKFIHAIKSHSPDTKDELLIHLRKVSAGVKSKNNCHPVICSTDSDEVLREEGYTTDPVVAHNGTMYKFRKHNSVFSDTLYFVKDFAGNPDMPKIIAYLYKVSPSIVNYIIGERSKLGIMYPNNTPISMIGQGWIHNKSTGLHFSNTSYKGENCSTHGKNRKKSHSCYSHHYAYSCADDDDVLDSNEEYFVQKQVASSQQVNLWP